MKYHRHPRAYTQLLAIMATHFPHLRPAQQRGLTLWVYGTILAQSACQNAVITALLTMGHWHALRQQLREWLYDGSDKAAPCRTEVAVAACFAPLLQWIVQWWQGRDMAFAIDATAHGDRVVALVVSVLYRGCALPIAWHILPANQPGAWIPPILQLLRQLHPVVPPTMTVLVLADRGLWSPRLWQCLCDLGWHPVLRVQRTTTFQPDGQGRQAAWQFVSTPGRAWVGRGTAFRDRTVRRRGTLVVVWDMQQREPWVVLTDLAPEQIGVCWYGLRVWVELGFRALKGVGWQWQRTRRRDPERVARHWLVLAVAMVWVLASGTRAEDAALQGVAPAHLRTPPPQAQPHKRRASLFRIGLTWLRWQFAHGRLWQHLWLTPELWPATPTHITVMLQHPP